MNTHVALVVPADAAPFLAEVDTRGHRLSDLVGGTLAIYGAVYVNDNGIAEGLPVNNIATAMFGRGQTLLGTVVLPGPVDENGEDTDVTGEQITAWAAMGGPWITEGVRMIDGSINTDWDCGKALVR